MCEITGLDEAFDGDLYAELDAAVESCVLAPT